MAVWVSCDYNEYFKTPLGYENSKDDVQEEPEN